MKSFLILALTMVSFSTYAHGVKRLTTTTCTSGSDTQLGVIVKWDSSISPFGPNEVIVNGESVGSAYVMTFGDTTLNLKGKLLSTQEQYDFTVSTAQDYETALNVGETEIPLQCNTTTKFRVF